MSETCGASVRVRPDAGNMHERNKNVKRGGWDIRWAFVILLFAVAVRSLAGDDLAGDDLVFDGADAVELGATEDALHTTLVSIGDTVVVAEVVRSPQARSRGLGGRTSLADGHGMLFVFEQDGRHRFWMKDVPFPIDIIWLDAEKKVVHVAAKVPPESFPRSYAPMRPARYVLEVPAGFAAAHGVGVGMFLAWEQGAWE